MSSTEASEAVIYAKNSKTIQKNIEDHGILSISNLFDQIVNGTHDNYCIVKLNDTIRRIPGTQDNSEPCWLLRNKQNKKNYSVDCATLCQTGAYVAAVIYKNRSKYNILEMYNHFPEIRHLCGNYGLPAELNTSDKGSRTRNKCCNPKHLLFGTRNDNQTDYHYHYFMHGSQGTEFVNLYINDIKNRHIF